MSSRTALFIATLLAVASAASAQVAETPATPEQGAETGIEPDRPDVTNGTRIVGAGLTQFELGGLYTHAGKNQNAFGSPLTVRVGLADWIEARIGTDGLLTSSDGVTNQSSIGNTQLGAKLRLWASPGGAPVLSILPNVNLPTADANKGFGSGDPDYTLALLTGRDFGRHWHIDANYGIGAIGSGTDRPHFAQHLLSVSASVATSDKWNPYIEGFWFSRQDIDGEAITALDGGAIYELGPRLALDGGVQISRSAGNDQVSAFGGLSMIVGGRGVRSRQRQTQRRLGHKLRASR